MGAAVAPVPDGLAVTGLPVRIPQADRGPGFAGLRPDAAPRPPVPPVTRSADAVRSRLSGYQRGTRRAEQQITRADTERADH
jgi:hypothetical protein